MKFFRTQKMVEHELKHNEMQTKLQEQELRLQDHARRLRRLEMEAGILKPPLRGLRGSDENSSVA